MPRAISLLIRNKIIELHGAGSTITEISQQLGEQKL